MIIESLLDCDLYKVNMLRIYFYHFANNTAKFEFKCRNNAKFTEEMFEQIAKELKHLTTLRFTKDEIDWIAKIRYHSNAIGFHEFLRMYQLNWDYVKTLELTDNNQLKFEVEGPLFQVTMWEIYALAIIQEVYWVCSLGEEICVDKFWHGCQQLKLELKRVSDPFLLIEFGTRRRFHAVYQRHIIEILKEWPGFFGTSNMMFAKQYGLKPCGTHAHEYICLGQAQKHVPISESQSYMLDIWYKEYGDNLGTALSDTLGLDKFLKDFTPSLAKLYDGVRHDSGDPIEWGDKIIEHYKKINVNHKDKVLFFSDNLTLRKASEIRDYFWDKHNHEKISFGIGTALTNNLPEIKPLNCVMKMVEANGKPVAKLSDEPAKTMCNDEEYINYLRWAIK